MWELLIALFLGSVASGFIPLFNAELLVIGAATAADPALVPAVTVACTAGQMLSKTCLFWIAGHVPARLPDRARRRMVKASEAVAHRHGTLGSLILFSSAVGFPPFYGVSLAVGSLRMSLRTFLIAGTAGRTIRFGILAWAGWKWGDRALEALGLGMLGH